MDNIEQELDALFENYCFTTPTNKDAKTDNISPEETTAQVAALEPRNNGITNEVSARLLRLARLTPELASHAIESPGTKQRLDYALFNLPVECRQLVLHRPRNLQLSADEARTHTMNKQVLIIRKSAARLSTSSNIMLDTEQVWHVSIGG
ncbi:hypothetical protein FGSG_00779 [Fusarium graminearum PH-1]|uniref:hypothetical protein n=1 Tax=Gibberella zeae (strain ATCC MYA-4620 / CBS 123657 / FGSC 9075 / NRRL 31084 / PH-1) TaxID=229533 RepID=UPI000023C9D9|nr:hypothetical protein FGSG_00779 [Fusarium graminearum PH-1]ESU06005.1 hypothetical protein FGSG_00779 [Fusarium graminearum PH-1]|eukprot:XP_011316490.1 hypothetical protein FGSG_00779 [Fusarium graminearum PH-1]